jgi:hypothetical protein
LAFLGFDGDIDAYGHFVAVQVPELAPNIRLPYRHDVWERLFLVMFLLDSEARHEAIGADPRDLDRQIEVSMDRFAAAHHGWIGTTKDVWQSDKYLRLSKDRVLPDFERRVRATARDLFSILTPERLMRFRIGHRAVGNWLQSCARRKRETKDWKAPIPRRPVCARNLHWKGWAHRHWPGLIAESDPAEQRKFLVSSAFPLVVPADMSPWRRDARSLVERKRGNPDDVRDAERVALLQSLWTASQGLKKLQLDKARVDHIANRLSGTDTDVMRIAAQEPDAFLFEYFHLEHEGA